MTRTRNPRRVSRRSPLPFASQEEMIGIAIALGISLLLGLVVTRIAPHPESRPDRASRHAPAMQRYTQPPPGRANRPRTPPPCPAPEADGAPARTYTICPSLPPPGTGLSRVPAACFPSPSPPPTPPARTPLTWDCGSSVVFVPPRNTTLGRAGKKRQREVREYRHQRLRPVNKGRNGLSINGIRGASCRI